MKSWQPKHIALGKLLGAIFLCSSTAQLTAQEPIKPNPSEKHKTETKVSKIKVYDYCDEPPQFPGGTDSLYRYIFYNTRHSNVHGCDRITGRVIVGFVIMPDGKLEDIHILRGVDPFLDKEAMRLVKEMPLWQAGKIKGKPVACKYTLPIVFRLQ